MQLRALAHRSASLSLRDQHAAMTEHRVFTTRSQRPREQVDDPVEYLTDSDDERMPSLAEEACLVGDLSDCTDLEDGGPSSPLSPCSPWDSEDDYPPEVRDVTRPLAEVLRDAERARPASPPHPNPTSQATSDGDELAARNPPLPLAEVLGGAERSSPAPPPAPPPTPAPGPNPAPHATSGGDKVAARKPTRRAGKHAKSRKEWTPAHRASERASVTHASRTTLVREARRLQRLDERREEAPAHASTIVGAAEHFKSSFKLVGLVSKGSPFVSARKAPAGKGGYTSQVFRAGFCRVGIPPCSRMNIAFSLRVARGPPPGCNEYVRKLVRQHGFAYIPNANVSQVFTDAQGLIYAVKPAQPTGDAWPAKIAHLYKLLQHLHRELKLSKPENIDHARGRFDRMSWGTSHGGGRTHPTVITPDWQRNKHLLVEFFKDPVIQSICRHIQNCVFTWLPEVAIFYMDVQRKLKDNGIDLQAVFGPGAAEFNLPFAAHTLNLGPQVRCILHRDSQNWAEGPCPVVAAGEFDHTISGHFIIEEAKVALELRSGDIIILLSSLLTHGNAPLLPHETRMSWTCWLAGGLVRWLAAGCALVSSLTTRRLQSSYAKRAKEFADRGWASLLTLSQLQERWGLKKP